VGIEKGDGRSLMRDRGHAADRETGTFTNEVRAGPLDRLAQEVRDDGLVYPVRAAGHYEDGTTGLSGAEDD
jgi:hypothetical protein